MTNVINADVPYPYSGLPDYEEQYQLGKKHDDMLGLLLLFDRFCREKGVRYSLADGTLLGAMRHADFIPWDDDADVMVTRAEYDKLISVLTPGSEIKVLKIHFLDRITAADYSDRKTYLDLFINEDMPRSKLLFELKKLKTRFLRTYFRNDKVRNVRHDTHHPLRRSLHRILGYAAGGLVRAVVGDRDVFALNDEAVAIGSHKPSSTYTRYTSRMYETKRRFNKESYEAGYADIEFRGERLMALLNADTFLREMYGDYMRLPPEEKRVPAHPVNMMDSPESCIKRFN